MKGTIFIKDQIGNERFIEVDLEALEKNGENIDDLCNRIIAELRNDEVVVSWGEVKKHVLEKGNK
jgi:hypothetical protein